MSDSIYLIRISSQKGGVGKTTVAVNLSALLSIMGYKVLLYDTDFSNPSVGFHLGLEDVNIGMQSVIYRRTKLQNATVVHEPSGMHVVPCELNAKSLLTNAEHYQLFKNDIIKAGYDFVIADTPPGQFDSELTGFYDEAVILTTPDLPALQSVLKLAARYDKANLKHSLIINRVKHKNYEIPMRDISGIYGKKPDGMFPESELVPISIAKHIPAVMLNSKDPFSKAANTLSEKYVYKTENPASEGRMPKRSLFRALLKLLFG